MNARCVHCKAETDQSTACMRTCSVCKVEDMLAHSRGCPPRRLSELQIHHPPGISRSARGSERALCRMRSTRISQHTTRARVRAARVNATACWDASGRTYSPCNCCLSCSRMWRTTSTIGSEPDHRHREAGRPNRQSVDSGEGYVHHHGFRALAVHLPGLSGPAGAPLRPSALGLSHMDAVLGPRQR